MIPYLIGLFALTLWAASPLCASAQEAPPPEGAPQAADPYARRADRNGHAGAESGDAGARQDRLRAASGRQDRPLAAGDEMPTRTSPMRPLPTRRRWLEVSASP